MNNSSCADIVKYLNVIENNLKHTPIVESINLENISKEIGQKYLFENGVRWLQILEDNGEDWLFEYGLIEHESDGNDLISKNEFAHLIQLGTVILCEEDDLLFETVDDNQPQFSIFMEKIDRFLLVNHLIESNDLNYNWEEAWKNGLSSIEAAEDAVSEEI